MQSAGLDLVYFPVWWYGAGLVHTMGSLFTSWRNYGRRLAVGVWVKNFFVPMYGQYSLQGRLISVFVRGVQILGRSFFWFLAGLGHLIAFALYVAVPIVAVAFLIFHLTGGIFGLL